MKIKNVIKSALVGLSFITSISSFAESGVYGGGPVYLERNYSINELKASGFTNIVVWTIHIESDGRFNFNAEFPLVENGAYVGDLLHPNFKSDIASLKTGGSLINRVEFGLSGYGSSTFTNVRDLLNCTASHCGTGPNSILYRNFSALKAAFPTVDALNNDDESTYDIASAVPFHIMLADIGFKVAIVPYTQKSFWQSLVSQVNAARPGTIDVLYLQAYAGGSSNNPCSWDLGIPVYPGLWSRDYSPSGIQTKMQSWKNTCPDLVKGGFMWLYDDFDNSSQVAAYAAAINDVFEGGTSSETVITARASISSSEDQDKAFDGDIATKWLDNAGTPSSENPSWINIKFGSQQLVDKLTLVSANDAQERDPQDIELKASNDGSNWTVLANWSGLEFLGRFLSKELTFTNTQNYNEFRLNISKNNGDVSMTQIAEISLGTNTGSNSTVNVHETGSVTLKESIAYGPYTVVAGTSATGVLSAVSGDSGDADLYMNFGSAPIAGVSTSWVCRPFKWGSAESCDETVPASETTVYFMVHGYSAANYDLDISYTTSAE